MEKCDSTEAQVFICSGISVMFSIWGITGKLFSPSPGTHSQYRLTPWLILSEQKIFATGYLGSMKQDFLIILRAKEKVLAPLWKFNSIYAKG